MTKAKPKGMGLQQLLDKKYKIREGVPVEITRAFGVLTQQILMFIYGDSSQGKSSLIMMFLKLLLKDVEEKAMYISPEEGHRWTMHTMAKNNLSLDEHGGKITFWDHMMTYEELRAKLRKKKSPRIVVVDSLQYWDMRTKQQWKELTSKFPMVSFFIISHQRGTKPDGRLAGQILYDVDIKVRVEAGVAFVRARGNGEKKFVIAEELAIAKWGKRKVNQMKK